MAIRHRELKAITFIKYYNCLIKAFKNGEEIFQKIQAQVSYELCANKNCKNRKKLLESYLSYDVPVCDIVSASKRTIASSKFIFLASVFHNLGYNICAPLNQMHAMLEYVGTSLIKYFKQTDKCDWMLPYFYILVLPL